MLKTPRSEYTPTTRAMNLVKMEVDIHQVNTGNIQHFETYVVWFCYILGGWKALVSTTLEDNMYYEVTYNKEKRETYLDCYKKIKNVVIKDDISSD